MTGPNARWHRVDDDDVPGEGRVRSVEVGGRSVALARCGDRLGAPANHCPHQGGPVGEGSLEKGLLRCPWHGYDCHPGHGYAARRVQRRGAELLGEGASGRRLREAPRPAPPVRTVADTLVETLVAFGI